MVQQYEQLVHRYRLLIRARSGNSVPAMSSGSASSSSALGGGGASSSLEAPCPSSRRRPSPSTPSGTPTPSGGRSIRRFRANHPLPPRYTISQISHLAAARGERTSPRVTLSQIGRERERIPPRVTLSALGRERERLASARGVTLSHLGRERERASGQLRYTISQLARFRPTVLRVADRRTNLFGRSAPRCGRGLSASGSAATTSGRGGDGSMLQQFESEITESLARLHRNIRRMRIHMPWEPESRESRPGMSNPINLDTSDSDVDIETSPRPDDLSSSSPHSARITVVPNPSGAHSWRQRDPFSGYAGTTPTTPSSDTPPTPSSIQSLSRRMLNTRLRRLYIRGNEGIATGHGTSHGGPPTSHVSTSVQTSGGAMRPSTGAVNLGRGDHLASGSMAEVDDAEVTLEQEEEEEGSMIMMNASSDGTVGPTGARRVTIRPVRSSSLGMDPSESTSPRPSSVSAFANSLSSEGPDAPPSGSGLGQSEAGSESRSGVVVGVMGVARASSPMNLSTRPPRPDALRHTVFEISNSISATQEVNEPTATMIRATIYSVRQFFGNMQATYNVIASGGVTTHSLERLNFLYEHYRNNREFQAIITLARHFNLASIMCQARLLTLKSAQLEQLWSLISQNLVRFSSYPSLRRSEESLEFYQDIHRNGRLLEVCFGALTDGAESERIFNLHTRTTTLDSHYEAARLLQRVLLRHLRWAESTLTAWAEPPYGIQALTEIAEVDSVLRRELRAMDVMERRLTNMRVVAIRDDFVSTVTYDLARPITEDLLMTCVRRFASLSSRMDDVLTRELTSVQPPLGGSRSPTEEEESVPGLSTVSIFSEEDSAEEQPSGPNERPPVDTDTVNPTTSIDPLTPPTPDGPESGRPTIGTESRTHGTDSRPPNGSESPRTTNLLGGDMGPSGSTERPSSSGAVDGHRSGDGSAAHRKLMRRCRQMRLRPMMSSSSSDDETDVMRGNDSSDSNSDDDDEPPPSTSRTSVSSTSDLLRRLKALARTTTTESTPDRVDPTVASTSGTQTPLSSESSSFSNIMQSVREFIAQLETLVGHQRPSPRLPSSLDISPSSSSPSTSSSSPSTSSLNTSATSTPEVLSVPTSPSPSTSTPLSAFVSRYRRKRKTGPAPRLESEPSDRRRRLNHDLTAGHAEASSSSRPDECSCWFTAAASENQDSIPSDLPTAGTSPSPGTSQNEATGTPSKSSCPLDKCTESSSTAQKSSDSTAGTSTQNKSTANSSSTSAQTGTVNTSTTSTESSSTSSPSLTQDTPLIEPSSSPLSHSSIATALLEAEADIPTSTPLTSTLLDATVSTPSSRAATPLMDEAPPLPDEPPPPLEAPPPPPSAPQSWESVRFLRVPRARPWEAWTSPSSRASSPSRIGGVEMLRVPSRSWALERASSRALSTRLDREDGSRGGGGLYLLSRLLNPDSTESGTLESEDTPTFSFLGRDRSPIGRGRNVFNVTPTGRRLADTSTLRGRESSTHHRLTDNPRFRSGDFQWPFLRQSGSPSARRETSGSPPLAATDLSATAAATPPPAPPTVTPDPELVNQVISLTQFISEVSANTEGQQQRPGAPNPAAPRRPGERRSSLIGDRESDLSAERSSIFDPLPSSVSRAQTSEIRLFLRAQQSELSAQRSSLLRRHSELSAQRSLLHSAQRSSLLRARRSLLGERRTSDPSNPTEKRQAIRDQILARRALWQRGVPRSGVFRAVNPRSSGARTTVRRPSDGQQPAAGNLTSGADQISRRQGTERNYRISKSRARLLNMARCFPERPTPSTSTERVPPPPPPASTLPSTSRGTRASSSRRHRGTNTRTTPDSDRHRMVKARSQARHILAMMLRHISSFFQNANLLDVPSHQDQQESFFFHERVYNLHRLLQLALHLTELLYAQLSLSRHLLDNLRSSLNSVTRLQSLLRHRQASSRLLQVPTFRPSRGPIRLTRESSVPISVGSHQQQASTSTYPDFLPSSSSPSAATSDLPTVHLNDLPLPSPPSPTPQPPSPPSYRSAGGGASGARFLHPRHVTSSGVFDEGSEEQSGERGGGLGSNVFLMRGAYGPNSILVPDSYYSPHHRIQAWDFARSKIPDIWNAQKNVVVKECKIHNDASVDISKDGQILVTLLPSGRLSVTTMLGVYSLHWSTLGQCLYTTSFELNAVSVSLSPTSRHLIVGLASRRVSLSSFTDTHTIAQIFRLEGGVPGTSTDAPSSATAQDSTGLGGGSGTSNGGGKDTPSPASGGKKGRLVRLRHIELPRDTGYMSLNCIRWAPNPGQGLVYGTNTGLLRILE